MESPLVRLFSTYGMHLSAAVLPVPSNIVQRAVSRNVCAGASGILPFRFPGQPQAGPLAVCFHVAPRHVYYWQVIDVLAEELKQLADPDLFLVPRRFKKPPVGG